MFRYAFSFLAPKGPESRLSVLIFHRICREPDALLPGEPTAERFDQLLASLKKWFNVIPLQEAVMALRGGHLPARPLCISFDDGYADNYELAFPLLKKHGLTATFFIATGYLDDGCMFNDKIIEAVRGYESKSLDLSSLDLGVYPMDSTKDKRCAIDALLKEVKYIPSPERERIAAEICRLAGANAPLDLMMTRGQVREMYQGGMGIGSHTRNHPILAGTNATSAMNEILAGKSDVEEIIGAPVTLFAYPNGRPGTDYLAEHVAMVRAAGFLGAVSTGRGVSSRGTDLFQIPRFTPWDQGMLKFGIRLADNLRSRTHDVV